MKKAACTNSSISGTCLDLVLYVADTYIGNNAEEVERIHARHGGSGVVQGHRRLMAHPQSAHAPDTSIMNVMGQKAGNDAIGAMFHRMSVGTLEGIPLVFRHMSFHYHQDHTVPHSK